MSAMNHHDLLDLAEQAGFEVEDGDVCIDGTRCTDEVRTLIELLQPNEQPPDHHAPCGLGQGG